MSFVFRGKSGKIVDKTNKLLMVLIIFFSKRQESLGKGYNWSLKKFECEIDCICFFLEESEKYIKNLTKTIINLLAAGC